jgi:hypothetical protein
MTRRAKRLKAIWRSAGWRICAGALAVAASAAAVTAARAADSAPAAAPPDAVPLALDIEGEVRVTNNAAHTAYHFDEAQLLKLPVHTITTSTSWTPRSTFTGPLLSDVLKVVGAYGSVAEIHALDDYRCDVPIADATRYGAVLAYAMNGQRLRVSDFGPLFLVFPRDAHPLELGGAAADALFAWQIKSMTVKH